MKESKREKQKFTVKGKKLEEIITVPILFKGLNAQKTESDYKWWESAN
jgi:hypothetical protein